MSFFRWLRDAFIVSPPEPSAPPAPPLPAVNKKWIGQIKGLFVDKEDGDSKETGIVLYNLFIDENGVRSYTTHWNNYSPKHHRLTPYVDAWVDGAPDSTITGSVTIKNPSYWDKNSASNKKPEFKVLEFKKDDKEDDKSA